MKDYKNNIHRNKRCKATNEAKRKKNEEYHNKIVILTKQ